jgi:fructose-bisphosphate aldolase class II
MKGIVTSRYEAFDTAGRASKIKPIPLDDIQQQYASGKLDPEVQ